MKIEAMEGYLGSLRITSVDTERGVDQYQVQFNFFFQIILKTFNYIQ
jgi:hypothetical protein